MKKTLCALALMVCAGTNTAFAKEVDTLQVSVRTVYPTTVNTVGDAVKWFVEPLGYYVLTDHPAPASAKALLAKPIPMEAMMHRTMPVLHAVQLLIGQNNTIIVDKKNRLITVSEGR